MLKIHIHIAGYLQVLLTSITRTSSSLLPRQGTGFALPSVAADERHDQFSDFHDPGGHLFCLPKKVKEWDEGISSLSEPPYSR